MRTAKIAIFTLAAIASASMLRAEEAPIESFYTPAYRGLAAAETAFWNNSFTNASGGANVAATIAPGGITLAQANVRQTTPGAFITAGHIYSFSSTNTFALSYTLSNPSAYPDGIGSVVFQAETAGSELDYSSVKLTYSNGSGSHEATTPAHELLRGEASMGSSDVLTEWEWTFPLGSDVNDFSIIFNGSDVSVSLERVMLDVAPVPEPGVTALAALAAGAFVIRRFRRNGAR